MTLLGEALNRPFPQQRLLSETEFASFLRERGFDLGVEGIRSLVNAGLIEELGDQFGVFHPFQIWPISNLLKDLGVRLDIGIRYNGLSTKGLKKFIDINWSSREQRIVNYLGNKNLLTFNQRILPFLLWTESYFLPIVRGPRAGVVTLTNADVAEWSTWRTSINFDEWLSNHSLSVERLAQWRDNLVFQASQWDPCPDLYLLLRSMPFDKRNRFRGRLRLAYDLYEMAEVTRLFIEKVANQAERKEWDPTGHPSTGWVERLYGSQPEFGAPRFLRPLIRSHGLDPSPRVRWLVEGQTEKAFIVRYVERLIGNFSEYATVDSVHGDGTLTGVRQQPALVTYLKSAREEQCFSVLTFDYSDDAERRIKGLVADELISLSFLLNRPDFERQNFTVEELVKTAIALASNTPNPIKLSRGYLVSEVEKRMVEKNDDFKKALDTVLHCHGQGYKLGKGTDWGNRLAELLSDKREAEARAGKYSRSSLTKIEKQIFKVLRGSDPINDFPRSIKSLDHGSLEVL